MHRSRAGQLYDNLYGRIAGRQPSERPWHYQWIVGRVIYADLRTILPRLHGRILDVGSRDKPYRLWIGKGVSQHVGVDVVAGKDVDIVVPAGESAWPLDDASFDAVLCTQVLEHASDVGSLMSEITRVLRPGGVVIATAPFIYQEHGTPDDFRRLSTHGIAQLFQRDFRIELVKGQGGIGSTIATLALNWLDFVLDSSRPLRLLRGPLLPAWLMLAMLVNGGGVVLDMLDRSDRFYGNVLVVAVKRQPTDTRT